MSAIAAFLVLSTPGAFAQEAPTVTMTPPVAAPTPQTQPTVPEPSTTAPVATPQPAQPAAPAPVIRVPLDIPAEKTAPAPKAAERAAAPAPARAERAAPRARPAAPVAAAATPAAAPAAEAPLIEEATPIAAPMAAPAEPIAEPTPLPTETTSTTGDAFPWEIAGGAAALLIIGGAGLAFARRRRAVGAEAAAYEYEPASVAAAEPVTGETQPWITPAYAPPEEEEVAPRTVPAFVAAPSGSMGRHEAMAMAGPTDDNPFATLSKRLKHARFLDRQERTAYDETLGAQKDMTRKPVSAWEIAQRPAPATQEQDVRRPEPARVRTSTSFRPGYSKS
ncbi:hypothetical protein ATE68_05320 [Sphingopyxis sp. H038]|uniref:hypothetical protein n=3 Tax=unclassified Sphingopyxis TaxID=2614943 RepID=UPI00073673C6|nr:hypothetical protein [Sphingopyxis sp. H038]KTE36276.1 hypothetical protein ATE68_05320 [Sphingopyxis sp. H038]